MHFMNFHCEMHTDGQTWFTCSRSPSLLVNEDNVTSMGV